MASRHRHQQVRFLAAAFIAAAFLPMLASATDYHVGDKAGWTLSYSIVFTYPKGNHTVTEVDGQTFKECYRQGNTIKEWNSGNDTVKLDKPGRRWFFCSVADHCEMGLKLVVNVGGAEGPSSPSPASPPIPGGGKVPPPMPAPAPTSLPAPAPPTDSASSSSSSAASKTNHMTAGEAVARAVVMAGAAVAACFI
ncbi:hypothetical protein PR202_gb12350 [Eleusine coracana subsp. coracana]|uniref:Phytocyanin domain-containing protein n=1 Tax=Eleusine coracana subsp. coracana TaxID=191504 RepID=A0AAV5EMK8_ELECO|nr:hypothetical protein PR202_gb12350 [Eleusine coracana subsp. coracana]